MRRWRGALTAAVLAALLLGLPALASGPAAGVNLMAVNDTTLVEVTVENMPRTVSGVLYVPYTMLSKLYTGIDLGVNAMYSNTRRTVLVTDGGSKGVEFNTQTNTAQYLDGSPATVRAMVRNSTVFLPIDWLCSYFGTISCTRTQTAYGTVIRLTSASAILSDRDFADAASIQLASALECYLASVVEEEGGGPAPSSGVDATEPPGGAELFLACRWGAEARECAQLLEGRGARALFLFVPEEVGGQDDLIRCLVGAGHTVGLVLDGGDVERCLAQAEEGRRLLASAARYNALVVSAPGLDEAGREALAEEGFAVWEATALGEDYASGTALVQGLDARRVNYVEVGCSASFLRSALNTMEEENCQLYQATAPALAA